MASPKLNILITAGPTRESLDPVRYLSNHSTGEMGYAIARAAKRRGFQVSLISGPVSLKPPAGVKVIPVTTAAQLERACKQHFSFCDVLIMSAAVSDFRPRKISRGKLPRAGSLRLDLEKTPDILAGLARLKKNKRIIGFCLETKDWLNRARRKLYSKKLDGIVANYLSKTHSPFGPGRATIALMDQDGKARVLKRRTKVKLAEDILRWVVRDLGKEGGLHGLKKKYKKR